MNQKRSFLNAVMGTVLATALLMVPVAAIASDVSNSESSVPPSASAQQTSSEQTESQENQQGQRARSQQTQATTQPGSANTQAATVNKETTAARSAGSATSAPSVAPVVSAQGGEEAPSAIPGAITQPAAWGTGTTKWYIDGDYALHLDGGQTPELTGQPTESWDHHIPSRPWDSWSSRITKLVFDSPVKMNADSNYAFAGMPIRKIDNITNMDLSDVVSMRYMFCGDAFTDISDFNALDMSHVRDINNLFAGNKIEHVDLNNWDVSNITDMGGLFSDNQNTLQTVDVSRWNVRSLQIAAAMFQWDRTLMTVDMSGWDVSALKDCGTMFEGCWNVTDIKTGPGWNHTGNLTSAGSMFHDVHSIKSLDLSGWDTHSLTNISWMFAEMQSLENLNLSGWDVTHIQYGDQVFFDSWGVGFKKSPLTIDMTGWDTMTPPAGANANWHSFAYYWGTTNQWNQYQHGFPAELAELKIGPKTQFAPSAFESVALPVDTNAATTPADATADSSVTGRWINAGGVNDSDVSAPHGKWVSTLSFGAITPWQTGMDNSVYNAWWTGTNAARQGIAAQLAAQTGTGKADTLLWQRSTALKFDANATDAQGVMNDISAETNVPVTLPDSSFTRSDADFIGWNTAADGSGTSYAVGDRMFVGVGNGNGTPNMLYAQWRNKPVVVPPAPAPAPVPADPDAPSENSGSSSTASGGDSSTPSQDSSTKPSDGSQTKPAGGSSNKDESKPASKPSSAADGNQANAGAAGNSGGTSAPVAASPDTALPTVVPLPAVPTPVASTSSVVAAHVPAYVPASAVKASATSGSPAFSQTTSLGIAPESAMSSTGVSQLVAPQPAASQSAVPQTTAIAASRPASSAPRTSSQAAAVNQPAADAVVPSDGNETGRNVKGAKPSPVCAIPSAYRSDASGDAMMLVDTASGSARPAAYLASNCVNNEHASAASTANRSSQNAIPIALFVLLLLAVFGAAWATHERSMIAHHRAV